MKVKVCGLNNQSDIELLNKIGIDLWDLFLSKSPRYQNKSDFIKYFKIQGWSICQ